MKHPDRGRVTALKLIPTVLVLWTCTADAPTAPDLDAPAGLLSAGAEIRLVPLVLDDFARTVPVGWGDADIGGEWRIDRPRQEDFRVDGSSALIVKPDNSPRNAVAAEGYGLDVVGRTSFSIDVPPDHPARYYTVQVYARRNDRVTDGNNYYRYRIRIYRDGRMDARVEKNVNGRFTWLGSDQKLATRWEAGGTYWIRWEAIGTSPSTRLRMRVWADGSPEPGTWDLERTVSEPALDVEGTSGVRVSGPNGTEQVTFPATFRFSRFEYGTPSSEPIPNQPPVAHAGGPYRGSPDSVLVFDGSGSSDPDGDTPLTYAWSFGDGAVGTGVSPSHTYRAAGEYNVTLTVTDSRGLQSQPASTTVVIQAPSPSNLLVKDSFTRTLAAGWGDPEMGGAWRLSSSREDDFRVSGGRGLVVKWDSQPRNAVATEGYGLDVAGLASFSIDHAPDDPSRYYTVQVYARRNDRSSDGDNYYRYHVRLRGDGRIVVRTEKNVNGVSTYLGGDPTIATAWLPGQKYWIRWECLGVSPSTVVRMRVWRDGAPEPSTWDLSVTSNEPALDVSGTTGFRASGPNGTEQTSFPVVFRFDDLEYVEVK